MPRSRFCCAQRQDLIQRPARLKRSGVLAILQLQPDVKAELRAEQRRLHQRRPHDIWLDTLLR